MTGAGLSHKNAIQEGSNIIDKWHVLRYIFLWFYQMKNLVDDRFDDIGAAMTNSGKNVDLDVMNSNRKTLKIAISSTQRQLPSYLGGENENDPEAENNKGIGWEKTDDEDADRDNRESMKILQILSQNKRYPNTARASTLIVTRNVTSNVISHRKLGDLTDGLKNIDITKSKKKGCMM